MPSPRLFAAMLVAVAFTFASQAQNSNYTCSQYTYFGPSSTGGNPVVFPAAVNTSDTVVGDYYVGQNIYGFSYSNGQFTQYLVPGAKTTSMWGINNAGDIVGADTYASGLNTAAYGFEQIPGKPRTTVSYPGSKYTYATGINNLDDIVGYYSSPTGWYGFIFTKSVGYQSLAVSGATQTQAFAINDSAEVVGTWATPFTNYAFIYQDGNYTLPTSPPAALETFFTGVNDQGKITGYYLSDSDYEFVGFVYVDGTYYTVTVPGGVKSLVLGGINNNGDIAGTVTTTDGRETAFLGTGCR